MLVKLADFAKASLCSIARSCTMFMRMIVRRATMDAVAMSVISEL